MSLATYNFPVISDAVEWTGPIAISAAILRSIRPYIAVRRSWSARRYCHRFEVRLLSGCYIREGARSYVQLLLVRTLLHELSLCQARFRDRRL